MILCMAATLAILGQGERLETFKWTIGTTHVSSKIVISHPSSETDIVDLAVSKNGKDIWNASEILQHSPITADIREEPQAVALRIARDDRDRLIVLDVPIPDWSQTIFWIVGTKKASPLVIRYRDERSNVVKFMRNRKGGISQLIIYDRWIGGTSQKPSVRGGVVLDRFEEVRSYRPTPEGIVKFWQKKRVVPPTGGGLAETNYAWISQ